MTDAPLLRVLLTAGSASLSTATPLPALPGTLHAIAPAACRALTCDDAQLCYVWDTCPPR